MKRRSKEMESLRYSIPENAGYEVSRAVVEELAPQELEVALGFLEPLIEMAEEGDLPYIDPGDSGGGFGASAPLFATIIPVVVRVLQQLKAHEDARAVWSELPAEIEKQARTIGSEPALLLVHTIGSTIRRTLERLYPPEVGNVRGSSRSGQALLDLGIDTQWPALSVVVLRALVADGLALIQDPPGNTGSNSLQPVSRLGIPALYRLARQWLAHREDDPRSALRWRWRFEAVEHDDVDALEFWAGAVASGEDPQASEAEAILGNIQALRGNLSGVLRDLLVDSVPRVRKALLRSLTYLLARRRLSDSMWTEVAPALSGLADDDLLAGEHFVLDGPGAVVAAAGAVRQRLAVESASISPVEAAQRAYNLWTQPWTETLRQPPEALRHTLTAIGEEWLVSRRSRQEVDAAARRVALEPAVFDILLDWASEEMRRDVRQRDLDDYLLGDLLSVLAGAANRIRSHYQARLSTLPIWERQLCEAARDADWFPTRRAALELLGLQEEQSPRVQATVRDARNDIAEVREVIEDLDDAT